MQQPDDRSEEAEPALGAPPDDSASPLDRDVEAPINAAVQDPDLDEELGTEGG